MGVSLQLVVRGSAIVVVVVVVVMVVLLVRLLQ